MIGNDTPRLIAQRLRLEREARSWSLADLAERSGVSKATISKIEREELSPTATVLVRLAGAFGLTLAGLLVRAEGADFWSPAATQPLWTDPETGYVRRQIFARAEHPVELVEVVLPPRTRVRLPASSYARIRQVVWVLEGRLHLEEGGLPRDLGPGDALGFGPPGEVTFANETDEPCRYTVALARS